MTAELSLVPPHRLGALLTERRSSLGLSIEEFTTQAGLPFGPDELRAIEQGRRSLTDAQINFLMSVYQANVGEVIPDRSRLIVDIDQGTLGAGDHRLDFANDGQLDSVLGRYLSLLYLLRDLQPGSRLSLRDDDLAVLADALRRNIDELEQRLFTLMLPGEIDSRFQRLRHRLAVPAAGILVGLTAVGSLVLVQFPRPADGADSPNATALSDAELIPATAVLRGPGGRTEFNPGDPRSVGRAAEALIAYPVRAQLPGWSIEYAGPRAGYLGNTNTITRTITVYVSAQDTPQTVLNTLAHEVGHAIDVMYLDDGARARWSEARGLPGGWWPEEGSADFAVGAGDFAEAVAAVIVDSPSDATHGEFTDAQLAMVRDLLP